MDGIRQVTPNLWRGPRPQSADDVLSLWKLGVRRIINLQSNTIEALEVEQEEKWVLDAYQGIQFFHQPMSLVTPPDQSQVASVLALIGEGLPTYLHCKDGVDRTGVVCAVLRIEAGATFGEAIGEMIDDGFHLGAYCLWLPVLQKWATPGFREPA